MFNINEFICRNILHRIESLFKTDIEQNVYELREYIQGKAILVIGGAGSIGSSFIKNILPFEPKTLVVIDINENGLAELTRDLRSTPGLYVPNDYIPYPVDFSSKIFDKIFRARKGFDIVVNFSAHKHVRSEKDIFSVEALLLNNVINLEKLLSLLSEYPPERFFCVSTDKAANPVNIMGASKKIMEDLVFSFSDHFKVNSARFANVAFSNGSLLAGFLERISKQQAISAPLDVQRYFVSPNESGEICMLACMLGENREIFFPKLDKTQMMTFPEIAISLLKEFGYTPIKYNSAEEAIAASVALKGGSNDYPVYFSKSDTTGEKGYEEFYTDTEIVDFERFKSLGVITSNSMTHSRKEITFLISQLNSAFNQKHISKSEIVNIMKDFLPNFEHEEKEKSLDSKM